MFLFFFVILKLSMEDIMKKLLYCCLMLLLISGCMNGNARVNLGQPHHRINDFLVYDQSKNKDIMCAQAIEVIHVQDGKTYAFQCIKSSLVTFVKKGTNEQFTIFEIIANNLISLDELVENNILFIYNPNE